jgi:hypothetical protein
VRIAIGDTVEPTEIAALIVEGAAARVPAPSWALIAAAGQ